MHTIAYVNHSGRISGAENSLIELLRHLPHEYRPVVICPQGDLEHKLAKMDVKVKTLPFVRLKRTLNPLLLANYYFAWRKLTAELADILLRESVSLVHSNSTTAQLYAGEAARRIGNPAVWHVRDTAIPTLARRLIGTPAACIAISQFVAQRVSMQTGIYAEVIHNGVDIEVFQPSGRTPSDQPTVAMIGQMVPWKGQLDFISMAGKIRDIVPKARFIIAGSDLFGEHEAYTKSLKAHSESLGLRDAIEFTSYCDDVAALMREIDLLVVPSRNEPFGRVAIEAMASGVPVVAYDEGGLGEIIENEHTGLLVPPGEVDALAGSVVNMLQNSETAAGYAKAARDSVVNRFNSALTARKLVQVYERLLEAGR